MNERVLRYCSGGPVDLGYGLGTAPPLILQHGDRLDLMVGTDIWTMAGRDDRGLPCYTPPANAAIDENVGWSSVERRGQKRVAALRTADDGMPLELWSFAGGDLRRYRASYDAGWTFRPAGSASFPAPAASKGLGSFCPRPAAPRPRTCSSATTTGGRRGPCPVTGTRTCRSRRICASATSAASGAGET